MNNTIRFNVPKGQYSLGEIADLFPRGSKIEFSNQDECTYITVTTTSQYTSEDISMLSLRISSMRKPENKVQHRGPTNPPAQHRGQAPVQQHRDQGHAQSAHVQRGGQAPVQQHRGQGHVQSAPAQRGGQGHVQQYSPTNPSVHHRSQELVQQHRDLVHAHIDHKSNGPTMRQGPILSQGAWGCPNSYKGN